jgi:hypothetical protein
MLDHLHALVAGIALASLLIPGAAGRSIEIPAALNPDKLVVHRVISATGVQIYTCGTDPAGAPSWIFKAPEAELSDEDNKVIGKHYAGPSWEAFGGKVVGKVKASMPAPSGDSIPWLLLDITTREGAGDLTQARAIVRMDTKDGKAPGTGCQAAQSGQELRVPYTAVYVFLK